MPSPLYSTFRGIVNCFQIYLLASQTSSCLAGKTLFVEKGCLPARFPVQFVLYVSESAGSVFNPKYQL